jgi:hypothetical protein
MDALEKMMEKNRMRFARVRTPQKNDVRIFRFKIRVRTATGSKNRRQTDDARCVSRSIATVDVMVSENRSR